MAQLGDTRDTPRLGLHLWPSRIANRILLGNPRFNERQTMNEHEIAERIIVEAQRWTEKQYTLQVGIPFRDSTTQNEAKARIELIQHIKKTLKEMRANA
jgi:tRNA(Ser,Leu) C12 N-acetylase TAN1